VVPDKKTQIVAGLIISIRVMKSKRGDSIAFAVIDDNTARMEVAFFGDVYQDCRELLVKDQIILLEGVVSLDDRNNQNKIRAMKLLSMEELRRQKIKRIVFNTHSLTQTSQLLHFFEKAQPDQDTPLRFPQLVVRRNIDTAVGDVVLGSQWRMALTDENLSRVRQSLGATAVELEFY